VVGGVLGGVLLAVAVAGAAEPRLLTRGDLDVETKANEELRMYVARNGLPDVAESRALADRGPWDDHEVVLYYLDMKKEVTFARAYMLGDPWVSIQRTDRELTDEDVAALSAQPSLRNAPEPTPAGEPVQVAAVEPAQVTITAEDVDFTSSDPADRAEAAAFRAEQAAGRVEEAATRTERAAARAEAVVEKMAARRKR
jgi:hypothetical protein